MEKKNKKTLKEALDVAESLKDNPAVSALILFGSHATGKNKPSSDVDLAVLLKDVNKETEAEIGSTYSQNIDLVLFHRLPLYIQFEVLKDGKTLYVRDINQLKETKYRTLREYHDMQYHYQKRKQRIMET